MKSLEQHWYGSSLICWFLLPLSWLYCAVSIVRRKLYQLNIKESFAARVPVVVIGNIVVGGSGKTPLLISLCEYLIDKGFKPGVVSRGYGGSVAGIRQVEDSDPAKLVGDEPLLIHQRTHVPVVVGRDRVAAVDYLLSNNQCDVVLSDDGLQHYRMKRSFEIVVIDAERKFGNGFCLPAGPLRERVSRLKEVDMIVYNVMHNGMHKGVKQNSDDEAAYSLEIDRLVHLTREETVSLQSLQGKEIHAVAGIGNPSRFFKQLRDNGLTVIEHAFPDHHVYTQKDFAGWDAACIAMTEKDAVKCRQLSLADAWVVCVTAKFSESLESQISMKLLPLLKQ